MAKKPSVSFDHLTLVEPEQPPQAEERTNTQSAQPAKNEESLKEAAWHLMTYISPEAYKAFSRLAVEMTGKKNKVKVHDLCLMAYEEFLIKRGINVEVRAKPRMTRK